MKRTISQPIRFKEGDGYLHGFTTGTVKVKSKFRTAQGNVLFSKINFLMDKEWTEEMPIMVWVIDHPEGVFVVDTGENAQVNNPDYFKQEGPILNYINTKSFSFDVKPEDEIGPQLERLGYAKKDISKVILTHLHLDHFDGLSYFENTNILVHQLEWEKPSFALPSLYPEWFEPELIQLQNAKSKHFDLSTNITTSGEIQFIHTPGHTNGHCSVLVKTNEANYLIAGDVTYDQTQLVNDINAGGHQSFKKSFETFRKIKQYASTERCIYLPSHDTEVFQRIETNAFLEVN